MATTNYSLRVDETDKQIAEQVFRSLGMTFSTGINIYLKAVGRQQRIPFDLALVEQNSMPVAPKSSRNEKMDSFNALNGILAGHSVDLDEERAERLAKK